MRMYVYGGIVNMCVNALRCQRHRLPLVGVTRACKQPEVLGNKLSSSARIVCVLSH